jgi:predicted nucleic acid-binding protein
LEGLKKIHPFVVRLIIDANIVFSALLNVESSIGRMIILDERLELVAPAFLRLEIDRHEQKLLSIAKILPVELERRKELVYKRMTFEDDAAIPPAIIAEAGLLVADIDPNDALYIALCMNLNLPLWTGDGKLHRGLVRKGFTNVFTTQILLAFG